MEEISAIYYKENTRFQSDCNEGLLNNYQVLFCKELIIVQKINNNASLLNFLLIKNVEKSSKTVFNID